MRLSRGACLATAALVIGLIGAPGADGYTQARSVNLPRGGHATFLQSGGWRCNNYGNRVRCFTGDAYPYAELTDTRRVGVTVKVYTLRDPQGGTVTRSYAGGYPVYIFSAFWGPRA
jgi:hypothetical protein